MKLGSHLAFILVLTVMSISLIYANGITIRFSGFNEQVNATCPPEPYPVNPNTCQPLTPQKPNCPLTGENSTWIYPVYNATTNIWSCQANIAGSGTTISTTSIPQSNSQPSGGNDILYSVIAVILVIFAAYLFKTHKKAGTK